MTTKNRPSRTALRTMAASLALLAAPSAFAQNVDPNSPGVLEPVMTALDAVEREIPHRVLAGAGPLTGFEGTGAEH